MMKRAIMFTLVLASCHTEPDPFPPNLGTGTLTPADSWVMAVRGSSVTTHAVLGIFGDPGDVTIAFGPLPDGLSSSPAHWIALESPSVPITITASPDAPEMELNVDIRASIDGTVFASSTVHLTVSGLAGSVDTSLPISTDIVPARIGQTGDGDFVVGGWTKFQQPCTERFVADGTSAAFIAGGMTAQYVSAAAISDTGLVAVGAVDTGPNEIVEFDAIHGTVATTIEGLFPIAAISFDGPSLFYADTSSLFYTATGSQTATPFGITSLETLAPGVVLAGGAAGLVTFTASSTDVTAGIAHAIPGPWARVTNTITRAGTTLVGLATQSGDQVAVARVDAGGNVVDVRALPAGDQWANVRIAALPNGEPLLLGTRVLESGTTAATLGVVQSFTPDFGVLGRALVRLEGPTTILDGVVDATGSYLYITGETGNVLHGYVARIRLSP